jgi:hypothetical protein
MQLPYPFRNVSRQLTENDIQAFEAERGIRLPESYRSFLLTVNGGHPQNEGYYYGDGKSFSLQRLYPLSNELESHFNLRSINHPTSDAPKGFLIIGTSSFGDEVCLGVDEPHRGKIVYVDHEERDPDEIEDDEWLGVYPLADTFKDFMLSLQDEWAKLRTEPQSDT